MSSTPHISVLAVGCDAELHRNLAEMVARHADLELKPIGGILDAFGPLADDPVGMVVLHAATGAVAEMEMLLKFASDASPNGIPVVVLGDEHSPELFQKALEGGALACLFRPLPLNQLDMYIELITLRARRASGDASQSSATGVTPVKSAGLGEANLVCQSLVMKQLMHNLERVAPTDYTILLEGECGSGKTFLAEFVHRMSNRRGQPFIHAPCGEFSDGLINSELFGHVKGAFTGADNDYDGCFRRAQKGTVLLDEIDCFPLIHQSKLLRVVEKRQFAPLGGKKDVPLDARLLVAANRPLKKLVARGDFRQDLYYRLRVISFRVPPLREHVEDLPALAEHFLQGIQAAQGHRTAEAIDLDALEALCSYSWPGNVRELENVLIHAATLCREPVISRHHLPDEIRGGAPNVFVPSPTAKPLAQAKQSAERSKILETLKRNNFNCASTARELKISRTAFYNKLKKLNITRPVLERGFT